MKLRLMLFAIGLIVLGNPHMAQSLSFSVFDDIEDYIYYRSGSTQYGEFDVGDDASNFTAQKASYSQFSYTYTFSFSDDEKDRELLGRNWRYRHMSFDSANNSVSFGIDTYDIFIDPWEGLTLSVGNQVTHAGTRGYIRTKYDPSDSYAYSVHRKWYEKDYHINADFQNYDITYGWGGDITIRKMLYGDDLLHLRDNGRIGFSFSIFGDLIFNWARLDIHDNGTTATPTPEPSTLLLLAAGLSGVGLRAYRRRHKRTPGNNH